jgi:tricorn protease
VRRLDFVYRQRYLPAFKSFADQCLLLRFPDVHGDRVFLLTQRFMDCFDERRNGCRALTAHPGMEVFAKFSPDGRWIAFTGQYDGDEQVYVMPATGGEPKQLTFYPAKGPLTPRWGYDNQVMGWTNDGKSIVFRSQRDSGRCRKAGFIRFRSRAARRLRCRCPKPVRAIFRRRARKWFIRRERAISARKNATAADRQTRFIFTIWRRTTPEKISEGVRASRDAMWIGDKIYYNSDRDGKFNLYAYDVFRAAKPRRLRNLKIGKFAGLHPTIRAASFTSATASWKFSIPNRTNRRN